MAALQLQEVVGLQDLVVELDEGQALLQADLVRLGRQHAVHAEVPADVAQEIDVLERQQPVRVVDHDRPVAGGGQELPYLRLDVAAVLLDGLVREELPHLGLAAGVSDHGGTAPQHRDGPVTGHRQVSHRHQGHHAADVVRLDHRRENHRQRPMVQQS